MESIPSEWARKMHINAVLEVERLVKLIALERERGKTIFPPAGFLFRALELVSPDRVSVVILGQDPYPTPGNAMGLAFSVQDGQKIPASLKNIFKELQSDLGISIPSTGDLTPWAESGVLLLNTVLSGQLPGHSYPGS